MRRCFPSFNVEWTPSQMLRQDLATLPDERKRRKAAAVARASNDNRSVAFDNGERPIVPLVRCDSSSWTRLDLQLQGEYNQDCEWANSLAAWRQELAEESKRAADEEAPPVQLLEPQRI